MSPAAMPGVRVVALGLCLLGVAAACGRAEPADLVLWHGKIVTVDAATPRAQALAVRADTIVAVGSDAAIDRYVGPETRVIDLAGRLAIPGFIEGHGHFLGLGQSKTILELGRARTWDEIVAMVGRAAAAAQPGEWILGRGWHQEKWSPRPARTVDGVPTHHDLSRAAPANPVLLTHASGHAAFANAKALDLAGITRATPDPSGGTIVRDARGDATGLLRERAQGLVREALDRALAARTPAEVEAEARRHAELAAREALSKGITTFHDAGSSFQTIAFFKRLADEGALGLRLYVMVRREPNDVLAQKLPQYRLVNYAGGFLTVRSIKRQVDGALGAHGAWLLEPYEDMTQSTGLVLEPLDEIERTAELAIEHGFQVNTHAIGDRANREILDLYARVFARHAQAKDLRWRIEHAQHLHPADIPRFAELGVIASMQGVHCTSDGPWVPARLGAQRSRDGAYAWRALLDAGAVVTNGTDTPVEDVSPIASFYASVTREMANGETFFPEQRMTREEALRSYTWSNAYAAFQEDDSGSLAPGKWADIVVLSKDILTVPEEEILDAQVVYTIVGGRVRYERAEATATVR